MIICLTSTSQASSIRLNPLTTLYYIAPPAAGLLCIPFLLMEARKVAVYFAGTATCDFSHACSDACSLGGHSSQTFPLRFVCAACFSHICSSPGFLPAAPNPTSTLLTPLELPVPSWHPTSAAVRIQLLVVAR